MLVTVITVLKMFYIIGLGLCDEKDISIKGLEVNNIAPYVFRLLLMYRQAVQRSARVYLESYTSILMVQKERLVGLFTLSYISRDFMVDKRKTFMPRN